MTIKYIEATNDIPSGSVFTLEQMQTRFPGHNFEAGPPAGYAMFEEQDLPSKQPMETYFYGKLHKKPGTNIWTIDVSAREMYPHEKSAYIEDLKRDFYKNTGYLSWTYDPAISRWVPPKQPGDGTPPPDGSKYVWNEAQQEWLLQEI